MTSIKERICEGPVHSRSIEILTLPAAEEGLVVEGRLKDKRLVPGYRWNALPEPPGTIHCMVVRFYIKGWPPTIVDAEAEMLDIPNEMCPETLESVKRIIGLSIVPGYGEKVRERIGGIKGCTHMTTLIGAMGLAALHGTWTQRSRIPRTPPSSLDEMTGLDQLINSCLLWREDGPILEEIRQEIHGRKKEE